MLHNVIVQNVTAYAAGLIQVERDLWHNQWAVTEWLDHSVFIHSWPWTREDLVWSNSNHSLVVQICRAIDRKENEIILYNNDQIANTRLTLTEWYHGIPFTFAARCTLYAVSVSCRFVVWFMLFQILLFYFLPATLSKLVRKRYDWNYSALLLYVPWMSLLWGSFILFESWRVQSL